MINRLHNATYEQTKNQLSIEDQNKEIEIRNLIKILFIKEPSIDKAYEIAKTIKSAVFLHSILIDICKAYVQLHNINGLRKAYEVAKFKERLGGNVLGLLETIIWASVYLKKKETLKLAEHIYEENEECLAHSTSPWVKYEFQLAQTEIAKFDSN